MSGRPLKVVELWARLTAPRSVSENGGPNTSVMSGVSTDDPVRYATPVNGVGYSGETAVAEPIGWQLEPAAGHSAAATPRFGASTLLGNASAVERDVSSFAACVISSSA